LKYLLDTDVVSQGSKPTPDADVTRWISTITKADAAISVITIQEIRSGLELMPSGKRRLGFELWLENSVLDWRDAFDAFSDQSRAGEKR